METTAGGSDRGWASVVHLIAFVGLAVPLGNVLGPLAVWLFKRHDAPLVDDQGREAVNFQISITIYVLLLGIVAFAGAVAQASVVVVLVAVVALVIMLGAFISMIVGAVRANNAQRFRYPLTIRWVGGGSGSPERATA